MPSRIWKVRIGDILESIARIKKYTRGYSFNDFEEDEKTVDSVLRNLEIIGEASRHVPKNVKARHPDLPWQEMNTMRNIVIHEYHGVNLRIIWTTINLDLPPLVRRLKQILAEEE
jgi:uncharacterized protein with HEPN domain